MSEYSNNASSSSACSYAPLGNYNGGYSMNGVPFQGRVSAGAYIVPNYGSVSYDMLTNQTPNCSGYFDVQSAYGADAGNCQTDYSSSACAAGSEQTAAAMRAARRS